MNSAWAVRLVVTVMPLVAAKLSSTRPILVVMAMRPRWSAGHGQRTVGSQWLPRTTPAWAVTLVVIVMPLVVARMSRMRRILAVMTVLSEEL